MADRAGACILGRKDHVSRVSQKNSQGSSVVASPSVSPSTIPSTGKDCTMTVMHSRSKRAELKADAMDQGRRPRSRVLGRASRPSANPRISKGRFCKPTVLSGCVLEFTMKLRRHAKDPMCGIHATDSDGWKLELPTNTPGIPPASECT